MKALRQMIDQRVTEVIATGDDPQILFTRKLPKRMSLEKWLTRNLYKHGTRLLRSETWLRPIPKMQDRLACGFPLLTTLGELAGHLHMSRSELAWYADLHQRNPDSGPLQHYRYRWIPKRRGLPRLLMEPKESLKITQRRLLQTILKHLPLHENAHGFRKGRSIRSYAEPHAGQHTVLRMDLRDFFPSITFTRVAGQFQMLGYHRPVAEHLAGLCTHAAPLKIVASQPLLWSKKKLLSQRHLPQGAPTSPALANAIAYRLDCRLTGLAKSAGLQYTRYADDLAFSGSRIQKSFIDFVGGIILEEGFHLNPRKTQMMKAGSRQHLAGVVVNQHPNLNRRDFDQLKATLHNCVVHGPASQNHERLESFRQHLRGRIAALQMLNTRRGVKLLAIYDQITW